ncbi:MAG: bifunctional diaminohydroxyphosphoribosylaminopyrimidine deaminase/5-amino-6-(5-phosphoribosylamino)uracil reductase RibD, partial [Deltaproteobacteria bacterium]|nr:bifunctional diaminohydroxyphosphoribosylaminopyrimidine deaminase/5-amino-6-(5-phosphoribosylamino)uracil reductase RibD [Deltaproteobacteria bacterium]
VTLEPCNHRGRTPPCTEALLASGIGRVVVGMRDPNPRVTGGGCDFLAARGVRVTTGVLEEECRRLNETFLKFVTTGRPFVIAKSAMTLDGWTATSTGHSQWVTNERSRRFVHRLRDRVDAVMVGIETVLADDPRLTVRLPGGRGRDPLRVVVDTHLRTPAGAKVLGGTSSGGTLLALGEGVSPGRVERMTKKGISTLICPKKEGRVDLGALMDALGRRSVTSVLLEGGASLMASMIREGLIDKFYIFKAPKLLGGGDGVPMASGRGPGSMDKALILRDIRVRRFGEDILIRGYPSCSRD